MPVYALNGKKVKVPEGTSLEEVQKYFDSQSQPPVAAALKPLDRTFGNYASEVASGVGRGIRNTAEGIYQSVRHPMDTAQGVKDQAVAAVDAAQQDFANKQGQPMFDRLVSAGLTGAENAPIIGGMVNRAETGGVASPESAGSAAEAITTILAPEAGMKTLRGVKRAGGEVVRAVGGGGSRPVAAAVEEAKAANAKSAEQAETKNAAAQKKADETNAAQAEKRKLDLSKFFRKSQDVKAANEQAAAGPVRKEALTKGVERLDTEFKGDLEKLEKDVNAKANAKYTELKKVLGDKQASPYQARNEAGEPVGSPKPWLERIYDVGTAALRGSETEPPLLKTIGNKLQHMDTNLSYNDLQGYREELGRELRKGTLPGDIFTAYKGMLQAVDEGMAAIADANGMKSQMLDARATWRQYAETFLDRTSPIRQALDATERGGAVKKLQGKDVSGIQQLAKYSPELASRANTIRGHQAEAAGISKKPGRFLAKPTLPPKPTPVTPEVVTPEKATVGPDELKAAREKSVAGHADWIRRRGQWAATWPAIHAITSIMHSGGLSLPTIGLEVGGTIGVAHGIARMLESGPVHEFLTKAQPGDVEAIPPDLRGDFSNIIKAAQKQGIQVSPALLRGFAIPSGEQGRKHDIAAALQTR